MTDREKALAALVEETARGFLRGLDVSAPGSTLERDLVLSTLKSFAGKVAALPAGSDAPPHRWNLYPHDSNALPECPTCAEERGKHPVDAPAGPAGEPSDRESATFKSFGRANRTRCESPHGFNHRLSSWSASDWITATTGELGEMANIVKKLNRVRDGIPGNDRSTEELKAAFADELADVFIYLDLLAQSQGVDLESAVISKFNRTSKKIGYPVEFAAVRASSATLVNDFMELDHLLQRMRAILASKSEDENKRLIK